MKRKVAHPPNHARPCLQCGKLTKDATALCHTHRVRGRKDRRK